MISAPAYLSFISQAPPIKGMDHRDFCVRLPVMGTPRTEPLMDWILLLSPESFGTVSILYSHMTASDFLTKSL